MRDCKDVNVHSGETFESLHNHQSLLSFHTHKQILAKRVHMKYNCFLTILCSWVDKATALRYAKAAN